MDAMRTYGWYAVGAALVVGGFAAPPGVDVACWLAGLLVASAGAIVQDSRRGSAATALVAFGANAYLFSRKLDATGVSRCNVNEVVNCDVVNTSAASELFGLPIVLFGMGFYLGLAFAAMMNPRNTPRFHQVSGLFAIFNLGVSAWLAWEAKKLGAVCVVCISIYAANGLLMWAALRGLPAEGRRLFDELGEVPTSWTNLVIASTFAMVVLLGAGQWRAARPTTVGLPQPGTATGQPGGSLDPTDPKVLAQLYHLPRGPITLDGTEPVIGPANARYQLVEFADFGCPHCARASQEVLALIKESPDFNVRFKVFPLTGACNPGIERDTGIERCRAAQAAECGHRQGRFWELSHLIFANQTYLQDSDLRYMAEQTGLDLAAYDACMADATVMEGIRADALAGVRAGLHGTPAFFLKGTHGDLVVEVPGGVPAAYALAEAQKAGVVLAEPGPPPPDDHGH